MLYQAYFSPRRKVGDWWPISADQLVGPFRWGFRKVAYRVAERLAHNTLDRQRKGMNKKQTCLLDPILIRACYKQVCINMTLQVSVAKDSEDL